MLGPTSLILIPCQSKNFVMSEHANIVRLFIAYSESQSIPIVHVIDVIVKDTNSVNPKH